MTPEQQRTVGARVAQLRKQRGLTQRELANAVSRTTSWLSQVERGVQPVARLDVLQLLADALGVSVQTLQPDAPTPQAAPQARISESNDLDGARLLLSGHPALDVLLADTSPEPGNLPELRDQVEELWNLTHSARFADISNKATTLVPELERTVRTCADADQAEAHGLLARTYQALAAAFVRQDESDAAWTAADRSIRAAEQSGDPLSVFAGIYRLTQAFVRLRRLDQAEHAAETAVRALERRTAKAAPAELSVLGALHLVLAHVHARSGRRAEARTELDRARQVARQLGEDRNDHDLEFGPTNVEIQAVSTAVDLGDAGEALDLGLSIDATPLSPERQARLLMDLGRAHAQRRHPGEALDCLLRAEELAPETIRTHVAARSTIRELVLVSGRSASQELLDLAERADALE
ncbi:helix-turn-helix transcriptional regulator [Kitasatospora sp. GP82]|uniref:helix-turn-helix domain-containing protein n=1 Tax=Kitasatospora sp. GP82 TaxID=3035089 RepID=UPI0024759B48|nr:helix-turn-helix transcriptional regulator [Kitasatospora sp. GP82]MDH6125952.1 transcriptional regulator with XRE-family HTH domain [Kitasatospora sp. GP82]